MQFFVALLMTLKPHDENLLSNIIIDDFNLTINTNLSQCFS
jgi:hypothetical protein